ncbi:MAG: TonB-dependent receptor plug domain-containing protein, partial [Gemmatimonadota bacterium]|nr:TonB-dependent receptor plug domain-containing protein [Gemmatimonadota bacterium]
MPLGSATVLIESMRLGAQTNDAGVYRFVVPSARATGQVVALSTRLIGYRPKSVPITLRPGTITNDFVLGTAQLILQQVVITGAGTITTSEKLGNKIDQVQGTDIANSHESNVVEALAGKAPNIIVTSQSGDPGASSSLMIRGIKSFSGDGQPLFVVDGVPLDNSTINVDANNAGVVAPNRMSDINPEDIESINILKGAAAAAIYGARAAQGVVIITTKSGKPGLTRYSLRSAYSFDDVNKRYPLQTKFGQGSGGAAGICFGIDQTCTSGKFSFGPELTPTAYKAGLQNSSCNAVCAEARFAQLFPTGVIPTYDHFGEMFEQGHEFNSTLSVSGGDDRRTFYLSAGRDAHNGFVVGDNDNYNRSTVRLKATQKLTDRFQVGGNFSYVDTRGAFIQRGNNVSGIMLGSL